MEKVDAPGERVDVPIGWHELRVWTTLIVFAWTAATAVFLIPSARRWFSLSEDSEFRGLVLSTVIAAALWLKVAWPYRQSSKLVFTTAGIWRRDGSNGRFLSWAEVDQVRLIDYGRGGRDLLIRAGGQKLKIDASTFGNPYALSRFIRAHVASNIGSELPEAGEL